MDYQNNNMNTNNRNGFDDWNNQMNQYGMWQPPEKQKSKMGLGILIGIV